MRAKFYQLIALIAVFLFSVNLQAQVTIGGLDAPKEGIILDLNSAVKGGLLLPNVELDNLQKIPGGIFIGINAAQDSNMELTGTIVYNTYPTTGEGLYIWDGDQWNPLAVDGGAMTIPPGYLGSKSNQIPAESNTTSGLIHITDNTSSDISGEYVFTVIAGSQYASVLPAISVTPDFEVIFTPNPTALPRKAAILVTNPIGKTNTFIFTQQGALCSPNPVSPTVATYFGTSFCNEGFVYAYVSALIEGGQIEDHTYYWLLNGVEVAQGAGVELNTAGTYTIYADKIGCGTPATLTITGRTDATAPLAPAIIVSNEGILCGSTGVKLNALNTIGIENKIYWFKDGLRQSSSPAAYFDIPGEADKAGTWYAVYSDGCASAPSNQLSIIHQDNQSTLPAPQVEVNDSPMSGTLTVCESGTLKLRVTNTQVYAGLDPSFEWFANGQSMGVVKSETMYVVPPNYASLVISLTVTVTGNCPISISSNEFVVERGSTPLATTINDGDALAYLCSSNPVILRSKATTGFRYEWLKDNVTIAGASSSTLPVTEPGKYSVRYLNTENGCWSGISNEIQVVRSSIVNLLWGAAPAATDGIIGNEKTYSVVSAPTANSYEWTASHPDAVTIIPLGDGSMAIVKYNTAVTNPGLTISVTGINDCGSGSIQSVPIEVKAECIPLSSVTISPNKTQTVSDGATSVTFSVSAAGSPVSNYEWYVDNAPQTSGANVNVFTTASNLSVGAHTVYAQLTNCSGTPVQTATVSINVLIDPSKLSSPPAEAATIFYNNKTCLDVRQTGDNGTNSWLGDRLPINVRPNDFSSNRTTFNYSFTGNDLSDIQYFVKDPNGIVSSVSGDGTNSCRLTFKDDIVAKATGKKAYEAYSVTLYAAFQYAGNNNTYYKDSIVVKIQDAACGCPVKVSDTEYKMFLCHNLGADTNYDPFLPRKEVFGGYWKWGKKLMSADQDGLVNEVYPNTSNADWNMLTENPCPSGWVVLSLSEVTVLHDITLNPRSRIGTNTDDANAYTGGSLFGPYFPVMSAGYRGAKSGPQAGSKVQHNWEIHGWTRNKKSASQAYNWIFYSYKNTFYYQGKPTSVHFSPGYGETIRCVSEEVH
jgi:hypothetical protein